MTIQLEFIDKLVSSRCPPFATTKTCNRCGIEKNVDAFYFKMRKASRRPAHICKLCSSTEARATNVGAKRERHNELGRKWYAANKAARLVTSYIWRDNNRTKINASVRARMSVRYKNDCAVRMKCILRTRTLEAIKSGEGMKFGTTQSLLGADWLFVRKSIEARFKSGMTWNNFGSAWEIDHYIPCSAWSLADANDQRACFNWRNLRPEWRIDNRAKGQNLPDDAGIMMGFLRFITKAD